jgi:hypothetical protein
VQIAAKARALAWVGGELYDVAAGWLRFPLDGSRPVPRYSGYGAAFDAVTVSPGGDVAALVSSTGTKALIMNDFRLVREVNRSYYHAGAYRYPLALFTLPGGRTAVVHCPAAYNRLEVEDAITGELLTASPQRQPCDVFHSRLAVSASGRYLLSAGWIWHPWGCLMVYNLEQALKSPENLDTYGDVFDMRELAGAEASGACFVGDDVLLSTSAEPNDLEGPGDLGPNMLARWSTSERRYLWQRQLDQTAGDLLAFAGGVLGLYEHPRLYDASTGDMVMDWPDLPTGACDSSIVWDKSFSGPARIAIDAPTTRFAVTDGQQITIVTLSGPLH